MSSSAVKQADTPIWLQVVQGDKRYRVEVLENPFLIGRGSEGGNHLRLDERGVSRQSAAIEFRGGSVWLRDLGQKGGLRVNGQTVAEIRILTIGDVITFGSSEDIHITVCANDTSEFLTNIVSRIGDSAAESRETKALHQLNLLLEAMSVLDAGRPLEQVLSAMLDHTIEIMGAERGLLLDCPDGQDLHNFIARQSGRRPISPANFMPSQHAIRRALGEHRAFVVEDVAQAAGAFADAESVALQQLRSIVAIPLYSMGLESRSEDSAPIKPALLGLLYLDSRKSTHFSSLGRQVLEAIAREAAGVIDRTRLLEREKERRQMEQELQIARGIQQDLLPKRLPQQSYCEIAAFNEPSLGVSGDYYDAFEVGDSLAISIADVCGKGIGAALLAATLQGQLSWVRLIRDLPTAVSHANHVIYTRADVSRYATLFIALLHLDGRLEYVNAGQPSPLLLRNGKITMPFVSECFPVGMFENAVFLPRTFQLQPDDVLVSFSDGLTDATNAQDEEFGLERLIQTVETLSALTVHDVRDRIISDVRRFAIGCPQSDDLTVMVMRYLSVRTSSPA